jgi:two-component system OmpR family sensor kinase
VIQVAQPLSVREKRAAELALRTLVPFALLLPVLALMIWLAVGHALKPLERLTSLVKARRVNALEPLPDARLPDEVQPLVGALNELLVRLAAALGRERAFMADAAHELRTPLTALHLQMDMLARASGEAERGAAMQQLSEGVQRAIRLVEQMLALAREEPRTPPRHVPVALAPLAREVIADLLPLADARRIDLGVSAARPLSVSGDPDALRTLLGNLVDNAVRYSEAGGRVDVSVEEGGSAAAAHAELAVTDSGPGIPPEERGRVFDRFYRRAGSAPPGSGLGLAIVKAIADAHGATLTLTAGLDGRGLRVIVSFPPRP